MSRDEKVCSVCHANTVSEDAPILSMGRYGNPRLLCQSCEELIEISTKSHDAEKAELAMKRLGELVGNNSADDDAVTEAVAEIFASAHRRAEKIKDGTYDFALDEAEDDDGFDEIPEELLETEEDRAQTEKEEKSIAKFNKVMDFVTAGVLALALVLIIIWLLKR